MFDASVSEHGDPVGDVERLGLVVGYQHRGDMHLVVQAAQPGTQIVANPRVQRAERLVEQQHLGIDGQRAGQRHALTLTAGELTRVAGLETAEPHHLQQVVYLLGDLGLGPPPNLQPEGHVVPNGQMLEGRVMLEDKADAAPLRRNPGHIATVYRDGSGIRLIKSGDGAQQCRLAGTTRAQQCRQ